jgi:hypothetical protein
MYQNRNFGTQVFHLATLVQSRPVPFFSAGFLCSLERSSYSVRFFKSSVGYFAAGLPDSSWENMLKREIYTKMAIKYYKCR